MATNARITPAGVRLFSNSLWNFTAFLLGVAANILTIPFALSRIGAAQLGIANLIQALVAPLTLVGTAMGLATAHTLAAAKHDAEHVLRASVYIGLLGATLGGMLLAFAGPPLAVLLFKIDVRSLPSLSLAFRISALGWSSTVGTAVLQSIEIARQNYARIAKVNALGALSGAIAIVLAVSKAPNFTSYVLGLNMGFIAIFLIWLISSLANKWTKLRPARWRLAAVRSLASFGGWQIAAQASGIASTQADRYFLGAFVQSSAVGWYGVAQRLEEVAYIGIYKVGEVLFPMFSAEASSSLDRRADLFARAAWMLNLVAACVLGPLVPLSHDILRVWTDPNTANHAAPVLLVLSFAGLLGCGANALNFYTLGMGLPRINFLLSVLTGAVSCVVSAYVLPRQGLAGAGFGALSAMAFQLVVMLAVVTRLFSGVISLKKLAGVIVVPLACCLAAASAMLLIGHPPIHSWAVLGLAYLGTSGLIGSTIIAAAAVTEDGRLMILNMVRVISRLLPARGL